MAPGSAAADYGSNYTVSQAYGPLNLGTDYPGTIASSPDGNWFYFDAPANTTSTVTLTNTTPGASPCEEVAVLDDANGNPLSRLVLNDAMSYSQTFVTNGQVGQFSDTTVSARRYYVDVVNWRSSPTCSYTLRIDSSTPAPIDTGLGRTYTQARVSYYDDFAGDGPDTGGPHPNGSPALFAINTDSFQFADFVASARGASFECQLDGAAWESCPYAVNYTGLADGTHSFSARAVDGAGAVDPEPPSLQFLVDRTAPTSTVDSSPVIRGPSPDPLITGTASAHMTWITKVDVTLTGGPVGNRVITATSDPSCRVYTIRCIYGGTKNAAGGLSDEFWQVSIYGLPPGAYVVTSQATDWAGNVGAPSAPATLVLAATSSCPNPQYQPPTCITGFIPPGG